MKKVMLVFLCLIFVQGSLFSATHCVRGGIDVGSGGMKVTVADVDPENQKINEVLFSNEYLVPLKRDMEVSGKDYFSEKVQQVAIDTLAKVQEDLCLYNVEEWSGIATAASRKAKNAQELYDRIKQDLGIEITIISQEEEGRIGFATAAAVSGLPKETIVAYDSGSGSFQLTTEIDDQLKVVQGDFAYISALSTLVQEIRKKKLDYHSSPNPVSIDEAKKLVCLLKEKLPKISKEFAEKLKQETTTVVGFGNQNFIFATGAVATEKTTYTKEELWNAIAQHCDLCDAELKKFAQPEEALVGMILLYTVMDGLGIDELNYCYANGSCEGLLIDPTYWTTQVMREVSY